MLSKFVTRITEVSLISSLIGNAEISDDFGEKRYKQLNFFDYDEDHTSMQTQSHNYAE